MLKAINISKSFGLQTLLDSVSFSVNPGERVGLVGRNGHGKTTIFRMITGEEHPDNGEISLPRGYRVGYVAQHLDFTMGTVIDEACLGLQEHEKDERWKAEKILFGLGFTGRDMSRPPQEFSGGFQVRLNLAKVLISEPHLLLLDEPTNYLDIISIRWLSQFLRQWKGELMLITHDRSFMDDVVTHTIGIHRQKLRKVTGNTEKLYEQIVKEEEIYEKTRINDEKKRKEVELFITRFRAKARLAGMVQSRVKALDKNEKFDRLEKIKNLEFSFNYRPFNAKVLSRIEGLTFSYNDSTAPLINNFSLSIAAHDRICVIGKNGRGKSTLLKLLAGELKPLKGSTLSHPSLSTGYFAQTNIHVLNDNMTVEEEVISAGTDRQTARNICGGMMFEGDNALKKISVLSGGEKSRVLLSKILATPANLLLLDEPTNHLDMESCDALLAAIDSFDGAVIIVTHNEMFLNSLANRFVVFQSNGLSVFEGTYHSFLEKVGWEEERSADKSGTAAEAAIPAAGSVNKKEIRKMRAQLLTRRAQELGPLEKEIAGIENEIISGEEALEGLNQQIIEESARGGSSKIGELSKQVKSTQSLIDGLFIELEAKTRELDVKKKVFDVEMAALE